MATQETASRSPLAASGYRISSCVLCFDATDLASETLYATAGYMLDRISSKGNNEGTRELRLNARNLNIESVRINDRPCKFVVTDYLKQLCSDQARDLSSMSAGLAAALIKAKEGELVVLLDEPLVDAQATLEISYSVSQGILTFCLRDPKDEESDMEDHMFSKTGLSYGDELGGGCGARCLLPCDDSIDARFSLKMYVETLRDMTAVAPGDLMKVTNVSAETRVFEFDHWLPIAPSAIGLAVGRFTEIAHPKHPWLRSYVLSTRDDRAQTLPDLLDPLVAGVLEYLGQTSSPPRRYSQVFVAAEKAADIALPYSGLAVMTDSLLFDRQLEWVSASDESQFLLAVAFGLACQWFSCSYQLGACSPADAWVPLGLAMYTALQSIRLNKGDAFYYGILSTWTSRVKQTNDRSSKISVSKPGLVLGRPLSAPMPYALPIDFALWSVRGISFDSSLACKAGLVMHMLEQRSSAVICRDVLHRLARFAGMNLGPNKARKMLSELAFLTLLKSRAGSLAKDVDPTFIYQWLRHNFIPRMSGEVVYNAKQNRVEMVVRQHLEENGRLYTGAIKVRVVEPHGTWDYEKQIDNVEHRWVFECRSVKKQGKGGRRTRAEEERTEQWRNFQNIEASTLLNLAASSTAAQARSWDALPVRYVILDPDQAWIMDLSWKQPEEFWLEMLQDDAIKENVILQRFAIDQLSRHAFSKDVGSHNRAAAALAAKISDVKLDEATRVEAVYGLLRLHDRFAPESVNATSGSVTGSWTATDLLVSVFKRLYCDSAGDPLPFNVKENQYPVRGALLECLSLVRAQDGTIHEETKTLLFKSLAMCDNAGNSYDDGPMLASLALAAGTLLAGLSKDESNMGSADELEAKRWIRSTLDFDAIANGPRNAKKAAIGCLQALCEMELAGLLKTGATDFARYMRDTVWSSDPEVRLTAFECILRLHIMDRTATGKNWMVILKNLLEAAVNDTSRINRLKMIKILLTAHAETVDREWLERDNRKEPAGCFFALCKPVTAYAPDELESARSIAEFLFHLINRASAYDNEMRILSHQLWKVIWDMNQLPLLSGLKYRPDDLGRLVRWVEDAELEYQRDEKMMIHMEDVKSLQQRQMEVVNEQEAKRAKLVAEQQAKAATMHPPADASKPTSANASATQNLPASTAPAPRPPPPLPQGPMPAQTVGNSPNFPSDDIEEDAIVVEEGAVQEEPMEIVQEEQEKVIEEDDSSSRQPNGAPQTPMEEEDEIIEEEEEYAL